MQKYFVYIHINTEIFSGCFFHHTKTIQTTNKLNIKYGTMASLFR